jgi:hypothetical protein
MFFTLFIIFEHKNLENIKNFITLKRKHKTFYAFPKKKPSPYYFPKLKQMHLITF